MEPGPFNHHIRGVPTHGGRYIQYNIYGNLFEVPRKYIPPIRPVGRGAYGIVWYEASLLCFFLLILLVLSSSSMCKTLLFSLQEIFSVLCNLWKRR